ncbi:MAG: SirB2 family protein [Burkholderiales bacterium]
MPSWYAALKSVHVACVAASLALFVVRGTWMLRAPERLRAPWVRVVPHVVDTLLLVSAVALAALLRIDPLAHGWLAAKIAGLCVYIVLGTVALKRGRTRAARITAFAAALVVFAYIVSVAVAKSPAGPFAWL